MRTQSSAYSFILESLPVEERAALLDLGARLGLTPDAPEWAMVALGRFTLAGFAKIPEQVEEAATNAAATIRAERAAFEQSTLRFVALADALPAQVEAAVRAGVPAIGAAFASAVEDSVADRVADRVSALEAEREKNVTGFLRDAKNEVQSVRAAGARAAIAAGIWYPSVAVLAILLALAVGWSAYFMPVHYGPVFDEGRAYESTTDRQLALKDPKRWAQFLKTGR